MSSVSGLDKRLQEVLTRPEFLEMRGVAKEVPIFIQTYSPADEDPLRVVVKGAEQFLRKQGLRVKHVDLFELVLQLLEAKGYLDVVLQEEAGWSKSDLFDTLQNVAEPTAALVPKLMEALGDDTQISLSPDQAGCIRSCVPTRSLRRSSRRWCATRWCSSFPASTRRTPTAAPTCGCLAPRPPARSKTRITAPPTSTTSTSRAHDCHHHPRALRQAG